MKQLFLFLSCFFLSAQVALSQSIGQHPVSKTFCPGTKDSNAGITATIAGTYESKWQYSTDGGLNWTEITDAVAISKKWEFRVLQFNNNSSSTLYFTRDSNSGVTKDMNGYQFRCVFNGNIASNAATITVRYGALSVTTQPNNQSACPGSEATFSVVAGGAECRGSITYKWWVEKRNADGTVIEASKEITASGTSPEYSGFNTADLKVSKITADHNGLHYRCVLSAANPVPDENPNSNWAKLTVIPGEPEITSPTNQSVCAGSDISFGISISASCATTTYQWQESTDAGANWADISNSGTAPEYKNAATATLSLTNVPAGYNNYQYRCKVTVNNVTKYSAAATLQVASPVITSPSGKTVCAGGSTNFAVSVTGDEAISYRWLIFYTATGQWLGIDQYVNNRPNAVDPPPARGYSSATLVVENLAGSTTAAGLNVKSVLESAEKRRAVRPR